MGRQNGPNKIKIRMSFSNFGRISESKTKQTKLRIIALWALILKEPHPIIFYDAGKLNAHPVPC